MIIFAFAIQAHAESFDRVPEKLQAALFVKILAMSKEISVLPEITVYVLKDPAIAAELQKAVGRQIGKSTLSAVNEGDTVPSEKPAVLYIGTGDSLDEMLDYCRKNQVLSITGTPELIEQGVTLGVGASGDKPKILLNISGANGERITWDPALIKISKIYK